MEPNVRHCRQLPPPSSSTSSAVIDTTLSADIVPSPTTRPASASPKVFSSSTCQASALDTPSKRSRTAGLRKSRTTTPTSGGNKLKLRQATSDAIPSQQASSCSEEAAINGGVSKGNAVASNEVVHRLHLGHANSELAATESSSIGDCSSNPGAAIRTSSNFETARCSPNGAGPAAAGAVAGTNNGNRPSFGRHIESRLGGEGVIEITARLQSTPVTMGSSKSPERNCSSSRGESQQQQQQQQQQHQQQQQQQQHQKQPNQHPYQQTPNPHPPRSKTTRVRINSTSEQIQDPNWLIRMSRELELQQQQQRQKKSHLKLLHRKLKSTITGHHHHQSLTSKDYPNESYSSSSSQAPGATIASSNNNGNDSNNNNGTTNLEAQDKSPASLLSGSAFSAPLVPPTPVKVPVSILKQRPAHNTPTVSNNSSPAYSNQHNQQQFFRVSNQTIAGRAKSPVPIQQQQAAHASIARPVTVGKSAKQPASKQHKQQLQQQPQPQIAPAMPSIPPETATFQTDMCRSDSPIAGSQQQKTAQQQEQLTTSSVAPKPTPICADGQVKVSGWKRKNLLAKTLSHFDEIRGNQRPIFMPTKIMLPPETKHSMTPTGTSQSPTNSVNLRPGKSKFAEIVREAVSRKNLLTAAPKPASGDDSANSSQAVASSNVMAQNLNFQDGPSGTTKRASYCLGTKDYSNEGGNEIAQLYNQHHISTRAISAEPSLHNPSQQRQMGVSAANMQHRSSSTGTRDSFGTPTCSNSPTTNSHLHSANLSASQTNKQQVTGKKHSSGGSSPGNSHAALHVSPQLVSQLIMSHAASSALSEASSSRAFKLQHKNQQVLQHLKHQLDPESSSHAHQNHQSGAHHSGNSTHIKDWKRLTSKLSLLTSSRNFSSNKSSSGNSPNSSTNKNLLTVKDDSVLLGGSNNKSANSTPLRLTVSNQESGKNGAPTHEGSDEKHSTSGPFSLRFMQKRNSTSNQQSQSPSSVLQVPESGARKLSSSSMVVQSTTNGENKLGSAQCSNNSSRDAQTAYRRSSDSEAYRVPCSTPEPTFVAQTHQQEPCAARGSAISLQSDASINSNGVSKQPIVVHRNDLIQILQVASRPRQQQRASNSSGGENSDLDESIKDDKHRNSLQLNAKPDTGADADSSSQLVIQETGLERKPELISFNEANLEQQQQHEDRRRELLPCMGRSMSLNPLEIQLASSDLGGNKKDKQQQFKKVAVRSSLSDTPPSNVIPPASVSTSLFSSQLGPVGATMRDGSSKKVDEGELNDDNLADACDGDLSQNQSAKSVSLLQKSTDLSWVVKKTSKVAFFHQKLRKMRWHSKQRKHSGENSATSEAVPKTTGSQQQIATANNNKQQEKFCPSGKSRGTSNGGENKRNEEEEENEDDLEMGPSDVFMDPTLIGDAIEIFLRNTMQRQQQQQRQKQRQLYQHQQRSPHRRESTGETRREGVAPGSEIDRRISLTIEASLIEPPNSLSLPSPRQRTLESEVISSSNRPASSSSTLSPTQASVPLQEAELNS